MNLLFNNTVEKSSEAVTLSYVLKCGRNLGVAISKKVHM